MRHWLHTAVVAALVWCAQPVIAMSDTALDWVDLPDPSVQVFEDPYRDLSPEQFDDVLFVVRLRGRLHQDIGNAAERQTWQALLIETEDALAADGIDIDWLLDQREVVTERRKKAATAGNPQLDGQNGHTGRFRHSRPERSGRPTRGLSGA